MLEAPQLRDDSAMRLHRRLEVAGVAAAVVLPFCILVMLSWPVGLDAPLMNDFISFWMAGSLVQHGAGPSLYDIELQRTFQADLRWRQGILDAVRVNSDLLIPFISPPALALLLVPLSLLPITWAWLVWSALGLLVVVGAVALLLRGHPSARGLTLLLVAFAPVADTLQWGQMPVFLLLGVGLGLRVLVSGRAVVGGALLGVLWLKPQYAVLFALVFLVKRRWRELGGMLISAAVVALLSLAVAGPKGILDYLELLRRIGAFYPPPEYQVNPYAMINWRALLIDLFPSISPTLGSTLMWTLGGITALASLLAWRGEWDPTSPRFPRQMLVLTIATLIASPHSHIHGAVLLLAPLSLLLARTTEQGSSLPFQRALLVLGYGVGLTVWLVGGRSWIMVPYSLLVMGLLTWDLSDREGLRTPRYAGSRDEGVLDPGIARGGT